jgi:hypothetical protein
MLSHIQSFIESGERKINEIQVRFNKLPDIFNRYDSAQTELELSNDTDHSDDRQKFEIQYFDVEAKFNELLHPVVDPPRSRHSSHSSGSVHNDQTRRLRGSSANIQLPAISLSTSEGNSCSWLQYRDTFEALIMSNATLTDVKKLHYLIASLKHEPKEMISNLQITNENFAVAWQLVTQRYNNKRLIAMLHAKNLCQVPK